MSKIIVNTLGALLLIISPLLHAQEPATIDLREVNWHQGESFSLAGKWDFFWQHWLAPDSQQASPREVQVPGAWHTDTSDSTLTPKGWGSFRLRLQFPSEHAGPFYLHMPDMASAYVLWSNGKKLGGNGQVAPTAEQETPAYLPRVFEIEPNLQGEAQLVIHTSNFHYQWGGIWYAPQITDASGVFGMRELPLISAATIGSILLATGLLSLLMFLSRRQDKKVLYFSLLCFAIGLRRLLIDERIFYMFGLGDWATLQVLENLTIYLSLPFFLAYFYCLFSDDVPRRLVQAGWLVATPFIALALTNTVDTYTRFNLPFQIAAGCFVPFVAYFYLRALRAQRRSSRIFGLSLGVFVLAALNDALNYNYIIDTPNMMHVGALAFVLFQLSAMIRRYFANFMTIERMSAELSRRNHELEKLDSFKDEFLATTSHELRTPLHGIHGLAQRLLESPTTLSQEQHHQVELIEATSQRLTSLVNDILDFSSIKHGELRLQQRCVALPALLQSTCNTLRPLLSGKPVTLLLQQEQCPAYVQADPHRLQQILFNLIGNAIKFTQQGNITVRAEDTPEGINISISDTGGGIPEDLLGHLDQPFTRSESASSDKQGNGLGLAITKKLLELHGSTLSLTSRAGEGTCASFRLAPAWPTASDTRNTCEAFEEATETLQADYDPSKRSRNQSAARAHFRVPHGEPARVFYADDEEVNRELVRSLLRSAGYTIETFTCASDLLNRLSSHTPDLVLLDLMMPDMNGIEACRQIRTEHNHYELPIMMLTARYQIADIVEALGAGANDYLIKPYHEQELLARLFSQLSVHRLWRTATENERLRSEIDRHAVLQQELHCANKQLQAVLDNAEEQLLLLDDELNIVYANEACLQRLALSASALKNTHLSELLHTDDFLAFQQLTIDSPERFYLSTTGTSESDKFGLEAQAFIEQGRHYYTVLLREERARSSDDAQQLLARLSDELAASRQRITQIESALQWVQSGQQGETSSPDKPGTSCPKELVVKTLRTALLTWERYTHQNKADLAEQSRCWRVYIDGTTAKTRTLDKYLSVKTLPAKPRWRSVIKTANYVIDHCPLNDDDRHELGALVEALDEAYS